METPSIIVAAIGVIAAAGGATAWFARSRGSNTIDLLQTNIDAYKDAEKLKDARILYLQGQIVALQETIDNLNRLLKDK